MNKILRYLFVALTAMVMGNVYADDVTDVLTWDKLLEAGKAAAYQDFSDKTITSPAVYAGQASSGTDTYIQLRTKNNNAGIVTTTSGGKLKSVKVTFNSKTTDRSVDIFGSNTAYTAATDLYDEAKAGTKLGSIAANKENKTLIVEGDYTFVGLKSTDGAIYIDQIDITWEASGSSQGGTQEQGQGQVWDFSVLPTQTFDGTGNIITNVESGVLPDDGGESWSIAYNIAGVADGSQLMNKAAEVFEPTKGIVFGALPNEKMVIYRNYNEANGGKYLFFNKAVDLMIPAKKGQVIEFIAATAKNNKKITSQDVEETFTTTDGETLKGILVDGTTKFVYNTYTVTVTVDNPYFSFENNICIQKITVKEAAPVTPTLWDFSVLPTQTFDGTGNIITNVESGVLPDDGGESWSIAYNIAGVADGSQLMNKAAEVFEPTKGIVFGALPNEKMVIYRNYNEANGGKYLFFNKAVDLMIPAKKGQVIEFIAATAKNNKKITSQDVEETFTTTDGETLKGILVDGTTKFVYNTYTVTVTVDNPYFSFENNICIQKITVKEAGSTPAEQGQSWDFTKWSDETVAALKADAAASKTSGWSDVEKAADAEAGADPTEASKDNCFWSVAEPNADGTLSANGVVIKELKGLIWNNAYAVKRSLAIAVNYPKALSEYAGPAYLWLGGGKNKIPCFTIPGVKGGSTITMEVESHKTSDARGVELYTGVDGEGLVDAATKIGDSFTPKTKESHTWEIANDCDVIVYNTNGCHIYTIKVEAGTTSINTVKTTAQKNDAIYNLAGQKVGKDYKGIVIMNGKKVVLK